MVVKRFILHITPLARLCCLLPATRKAEVPGGHQLQGQVHLKSRGHQLQKALAHHGPVHEAQSDRPGSASLTLPPAALKLALPST